MISYLKSAFGPNPQRIPAGLIMRVRPAWPSRPALRPNGLMSAHRVADPNPLSYPLSRLTAAGLRCRSLLIKVSIITFPSSLWSRRSKPHRKLTTVAWENSNFGEPPRSAVMRRREHEPAPPPAQWWTTEIRSQRMAFNEVHRPMSRRQWTRSTVSWT
jgi:hypothetical protein